MKYLTIYDNTGFILSQMSGGVREPVGIPFMWIEIPEGKRLISINTTKSPHEPVFVDYPKSETEMRIAEANNKVEATAEALNVLFTEILPLIMM